MQKFQLNVSKHVGEKCRKLCISSIQKWQNSYKIWRKLTTLNICKISAQYVKACSRKVHKTAYFQDSKFKKGRNSNKNCRKLTTLELDQSFIRESDKQHFSSICRRMYEKSAENRDWRSKKEVPRDVRNSKVREQDKFRRDLSQH